MLTQVPSLDRIVDILTDIPPPEAVLNIQATEEEELRLSYLAERNEAGKLTADERAELDSILLAEHMVIMAKAKAFARMKSA